MSVGGGGGGDSSIDEEVRLKSRKHLTNMVVK